MIKNLRQDWRMFWLVSLMLVSGPAGAVALTGEGAPSSGQQPSPPASPDPQQAEPPEIPRYEETVIVTASKVEQKLIDAPATMSVLTTNAIANVPAQNFGDLLRTVPGLNVTQTSARDINLTSRAPTSTLATSQLALLDGRTIYLDFFGFIMWDLLPVNLDEIKQIEVIRGPASAIWGANAQTGVVNIITKSPREMQGTSFTMGFGGFGRSTNGSSEDAGTLFYVSGTHAEAVNDRWAYKVSAGVSTQDPLARPTGTIPNAFRTPYPPFPNQGTTQPKLDVRADYDFRDGRQKLVIAGGVAGTEGIIHSGVGPFDVASGTTFTYLKANYSRGNMKLNVFANLLNGEADNLLSRGVTGIPLNFLFDTQTFDVEFGDVRPIGTRHVVSYGGNVRHNRFDLSIAPRGDTRNEAGFYAQDEIFLSDHFRWVVGARVDKFDVLDDPVFSPRTTFIVKPTAAQAIRFSYNRAYRAPSLVNNYFDISLLNQIDLGLIVPALAGRLFNFPIRGVGSEDLTEESLTAYEIAYTGTIRERTTVSAAWYRNIADDPIFFTQVGSYRATSPPPGWPLPPAVLELLIAGNAFGPGNGLPNEFSYRNLGSVTTNGIELGVNSSVSPAIELYGNYSWQGEPDPEGFPLSELNLPPTHRFNVGIGAQHGRYFGSFSVQYTGSAFWQDVLDSRFHGTTDDYTLLNGSFGVRWAGDRLLTSIKASNLANQRIQQHVFGDVLRRQVAGELRVRF